MSICCPHSIHSANHGSTYPRVPCFGEAVVASDMPEPCEFLSINSCQKKFLWAFQEVDLPQYLVFGLVLQVKDVEKFPQAFVLKSRDLFLRVNTQGPWL